MMTLEGIASGSSSTSTRPFIGIVSLALVTILSGTSAEAGPMHARSVIGLGVHSQLASHHGVAHAERHQGSKYRISHEELGNNYTYGNAGSGHAHHHNANLSALPEGEHLGTAGEVAKTPPPEIGSKGSSQYVNQTWLPSTTGDGIVVAWTRDSFLQIDPAELALGNRVVSRAQLVAGRLVGSVELAAQLGNKGEVQVSTHLTGAFEGQRFELVTHPTGVVSLQFKEGLEWLVPGDQELEVSLEASIDTEGKL